MQLTRFTDYALRTLIYLGLHQDRLATIAEISKVYQLSENHLMKIVHKLGQHGYIDTVRGKGGGMRIVRRLDTIRLGAVVRDCEETMDLAECFDPKNRDCPMLPACALQSALIAARESFLRTLDTYTVADLVANKRGIESPIAFVGRKADITGKPVTRAQNAVSRKRAAAKKAAAKKPGSARKPGALKKAASGSKRRGG